MQNNAVPKKWRFGLLISASLVSIAYSNCSGGFKSLDGSSSYSNLSIAPASSPVAVPNMYNLGMNVPGISYYNRAPMYADVVMQFGGNNGAWDASNSTAAPLDATGAPTVAAGGAFTGSYPSGTYTITWDGTGTITCNSEPCTVQPPTTSNGIQHNTMTLAHTQNGAQYQGLKAQPPVTNIHIMAPASSLSASGYFMAEFVKRLRPFRTLRFMDAVNANGSTITNWSERSWPSEGSRNRAQGMAYEDIIRLANETGADIHINIPIRATDDYVCRLARLLKYGEPGDKLDGPCNPNAAPTTVGEIRLNAESKVYVELANEIWNWGFTQIAQNECMTNGAHPEISGWPSCANLGAPTTPTSAIARAALANTSLPWDNSNLWNKGTQMVGLLTKRNNDIFKAVFADDSARIKTILNMQSAWPASGDSALLFLKNAYGSASAFVDEVAVAPYFDVANTADRDTPDHIFADLQTQGIPTQAAAWINADLLEAQTYGISLMAYEGGQGLGGTTPEIAAEDDPRMYDAYQQYFALWAKLVGKNAPFIVYSMASANGSYGSWGHLTDLYEPGSQKWDAIISLTRLPGDANLDGVVDQADCDILRANYGQSSMWWEQGDFNHDGKVDAADLALLNANISGAQCVAP